MIYYLTNQQTISTQFNKTSEKDILYFLDNCSIIGLDSETDGLDYHQNKVLLVQIGNQTDQFVIDVTTVNIDFLKPFLEDSSKLKVLHNASFDYNMLKQHNIYLDGIYDTMLGEMVIYNGKYEQAELRVNKRYSLAGTYGHYFNQIIDKGEQKSFVNSSGIFTTKQIEYAANDIIFVYDIYHKQQPLLKEYNLYRTLDLENKACLAIADIEYNGFKLNQSKWMILYNEYRLRQQQLNTDLNNLFFSEVDKMPKSVYNKYKVHAFQLSVFGDEDRTPVKVNWGSSKQVLEVLSGYNVHPTDKYGKSTADYDALDKVKDQCPLIPYLLELSTCDKVVSTYGQTFIEKYVSKITGRCHSHYHQIVDTGRVSSRNPNLQNIVADKRFRECFEAEDGNMLITCDYDSQELRILADVSKDTDFIQFFRDGVDVHSKVASMMFSVKEGRHIEVSKKVNPELRNMAKSLNFKLAFGGTAFSLKEDLKVSQDEAQALIDLYFKTFPGMQAYFKKYQKFALDNGYILIDETVGRRRWLPEWEQLKTIKDDSKWKIIGNIKRKAINSPIQGRAGSISKVAIILLREALKDTTAKMVNFIHDEICVECKENEAEQISTIIKDCMLKAGSYFVKSLPLPASSSIAKYWQK